MALVFCSVLVTSLGLHYLALAQSQRTPCMHKSRKAIQVVGGFLVSIVAVVHAS